MTCARCHQNPLHVPPSETCDHRGGNRWDVNTLLPVDLPSTRPGDPEARTDLMNVCLSQLRKLATSEPSRPRAAQRFRPSLYNSNDLDDTEWESDEEWEEWEDFGLDRPCPAQTSLSDYFNWLDGSCDSEDSSDTESSPESTLENEPFPTTSVSCDICFDSMSTRTARPCCGRPICKSCLARYVDVELDDHDRTFAYTGVKCPSVGCDAEVTPTQAMYLLPLPLARRMVSRLQRDTVTKERVETEILFEAGTSWRQARCSARIDRDRQAYLSWAKAAGTRSCPRCNVRIEKNQGCDHMLCARCKFTFNWSAAPERIQKRRGSCLRTQTLCARCKFTFNWSAAPERIQKRSCLRTQTTRTTYRIEVDEQPQCLVVLVPKGQPQESKQLLVERTAIPRLVTETTQLVQEGAGVIASMK
eukprot:CAMPEP_0175877700 /NCGR_PEP_ID=MMETSP0107_2-20121207/40771_1 /TAXON_ID=195067 ORGANISM="Goniomonas pacifica, Strain CCMP1869" /NCGR_SAMPLE_ID=MMETSP0107_2 /ASSEMBLY_ACC=CAM_ASM_000203 /LENGTH=415 /DNA_ID=CAMNT_0017197089 /DNA_START=68 /DNA_END=1312 /DNA_ORIENTATION=+